MAPEDLWDRETAERYDTPGIGMFAPEVTGPTADRLAALAAGGPALELAIGSGRIALPLAERGVAVSGIELSPAMLARFAEKPGAESIPVTLGDMASTRVDGDFSLVYLVYNTIGNLLTQSEQVACFHNAAAHLRPGGCFVIELMVPELRKLPPGQSAVVFETADGYIGLDTYDVLEQRLVSHHFSFGPDGAAELSLSPHRYIWPSELDLMGQLAGFTLESRWADWDRSAFTADSRSHVSVYRLRS
jgi:SAM-dependent methyltransferase